jgi:hypothetical protein
MKRYIVLFLFFTLGIITLSYSQTPDIIEFKKLLYKSTIDSVENLLIKRGYSYEKAVPYSEAGDEYVLYYFKRTDPTINAKEQIIFYKKKKGISSTFFEKVLFGTYNEKYFYTLKSSLPPEVEKVAEESVGKCLNRKYSNGSFISYNFNICEPENSSGLQLYLFSIYFDF